MLNFRLALIWTGSTRRNHGRNLGTKAGATGSRESTLKGRRSGNLSLKVSEKGGLGSMGWVVSRQLYKEQWVKLLGFAGEIESFIKENESQLKTKGEWSADGNLQNWKVAPRPFYASGTSEKDRGRRRGRLSSQSFRCPHADRTVREPACLSRLWLRGRLSTS
jgi:hypothetical protein